MNTGKSSIHSSVNKVFDEEELTVWIICFKTGCKGELICTVLIREQRLVSK